MLNLCYCFNTVPSIPNSETIHITTPDEIRSALTADTSFVCLLNQSLIETYLPSVWNTISPIW